MDRDTFVAAAKFIAFLFAKIILFFLFLFGMSYLPPIFKANGFFDDRPGTTPSDAFDPGIVWGVRHYLFNWIWVIFGLLFIVFIIIWIVHYWEEN